MFIPDAAIHIGLDAIYPTGTGATRLYLSVHTDYSATGANLHNAKVATEWNAAASRQKALTASTNIAISGACTIKWIGTWGGTTGDTFKGMSPNGSAGDFTFQLDLTNNRVYAEGSGLANDEKVTFYGATAPTGLTAGTTYWVVGVTAGDPDYFQVSLTQGGAAIDITGQHAAGCVVSDIIEDVYAGAGTHTVSTFTINL
jgi:hypothetical protein